MRKVKSYKCPDCGIKYQSLKTWGNHIDSKHPNTIPNGWSYARYFYYLQTGRDSGSCIVCKKDTLWNETTQKYNRFCENPNCKKEYREMFKNRMIKKYGKVTLLNDQEQQRKMLANRKISGTYTFKNGTRITYTGSYEKDFVKFLDTFLHFDPSDLMMPSPHTYSYKYINPEDKEHEGEHFYIPDAFIPSINLEIEIKQSTNTHPKLLRIDAVKTAQKDEMMNSIDGIRYIKILDKDYTKFLELLNNLSEEVYEIASESSSSIRFTENDDMFISKGKKKLNSFSFLPINMNNIYEYKKSYPSLSHVRINKNTKGELVFDNDKLVGYYQTEKRDSSIWLIAFEIMDDYKGYGLSPQLLKRCINRTKITNLTVNSKNEVAHNLYKKYGFKDYKLSDNVIFMAR